MIAGLGVDLVHLPRVARVLRRHRRRFAERILHPRELREFGKARQPARFLAKAFAAKEAFVKALGTGFRGVTHQDVGLARGALGRPELVFSPALKKKLARLGIARAHVSLSDEGDLMVAAVILEK